MTEKELEGAKKLIENKDVKKGSYSFIGDSNITYADIKILLDYIKQLEQEYQKQKEVIAKAIEFINREIEIIKIQPSENKSIDEYILSKYNGLLKILKEVE